MKKFYLSDKAQGFLKSFPWDFRSDYTEKQNILAKFPDSTSQKKRSAQIKNREKIVCLVGYVSWAFISISAGFRFGWEYLFLVGIFGGLVIGSIAAGTKVFFCSSTKDPLEAEKFVNNPLNKLNFLTYQFGTSLQKWLKKYNHLVEGRGLEQLTNYQEQILSRTKPLIEQALQFFEQYVRLYNWHVSTETIRGTKPSLPTVGINLEELQQAVWELDAISSPEEALESAQEALEREVQLIELQRELGNLPLLNNPVTSS